MRAERCDAVVLNVVSTAATASGRSARGPLGCQSSAPAVFNVGYPQKLGSVPSTSASTNCGSDARLIVASASARGAAAARGRVERRIGHLSVVERGLRRSAAARAWVLIAATWRGDGVASALARGHGSGGGSESATASVHGLLLRKCCAACSCRARRAQQLAPSSRVGLAPRRPRPRRRAALSDKGEQSSNRCSPTRAVAYVCWGVSRAFGQPFRAALFAQTASRTDQTKSGRSFRLAY